MLLYSIPGGRIGFDGDRSSMSGEPGGRPRDQRHLRITGNKQESYALAA